MQSLDAFVEEASKAKGKHPKCVTCNLSTELLSQIEVGRTVNNYTYKVLADWLRTQGEDIPVTTIANHFKADHHLGA